MPIRHIADTDVTYYLVVYDEQGNERPEPDGTYLSEAVRRRVADVSAPVTDVFFTSHGWKGDVPAAIQQYDLWVGAMAALKPDLDAARSQRPGFEPLVIGLHWPSLPWGDESIPTGGGSGGLLSAPSGVQPTIEAQVDEYAARISATPKARQAIRVILEAARQNPDAASLSAPLLQAYATVFAESGLGSGDHSGRPGADQDGFDPAAIIAAARALAVDGAAGGQPALLGLGEELRDVLTMPLRQLSFWKMKDRARQFGESGAHALLRALQLAAPRTRFHLMGHSFGCIVVSATVAGAPDAPPLPRPVESLFLVQGALSLWSYAGEIPYAPGTMGYFHRIVTDALVRGPLVTTRSTYDTAVGRFYPMGARLKQQLVLGDEYPEYGGIGSFGIQGVSSAEDMLMQSATFRYPFREGRIYNLEASNIIRNGGGASGAHSDIAHPEVAHAFWAAVLPGAWSGTLSGAPAPSGDQAPGFQVDPYPPQRTGPGAAPASAEPPRAAPAAAPPGVAVEEKDYVFAAPTDEASLGIFVNSKEVAEPLRREQEVRLTKSEDEREAAGTPRVEIVRRGDSPTRRGGLLGAEQPNAARPQEAAEVVPSEAQASPRSTEKRWINAEVEDRAPDQPLNKGQWYTVAFDVDIEQRPTAVGSAPLADEHLFDDAVDEVVLTVQLDSADFEISDRTRPLRLPHVGKSYKKARFDVSPVHDGPSMIKATIHKDGNFIQQMELMFDVGAKRATPVQVTARGRPLGAANVVHPRDVGLSISPGVGGYECMVWGAVSARARLPIQPAFLASAIEAARRELMKVVMHQSAAGEFVFQTGVDIRDADRDDALKTMARAGALLFQKLFFGPAAGEDSKAVGEFLRKMATNRAATIKLQILAENTPLPWGLLYVGDASAGAKLDWDNFIGMRHLIEQIPLQNTPTVLECAIPSDMPQLAVSVNVNNGIDKQMGADFVKQHQKFWADATASRKRVRVTARTTSVEVIHALADSMTDDQILYFYCHAESTGLTDAGGPDTSCLVLTDARITLGDLNLDAPTTTQLRGNPLVFINACESAEMSPAFYDGFVPYFMAKGARGVIGTECKTPALFAVAWAKRFFERFLDGEPLAEVFLGLRREFLEQHGNPLGLLYAVHCDGDTQVQPALAAA